MIEPPETEEIEITRLDVDTWLRHYRPTLMTIVQDGKVGVWEIGLDTPILHVSDDWKGLLLALVASV